MSDKKHIAFVPGLGADYRFFEKQLAEFPEAMVVTWKEPNRGESMSEYARRLLEQIPVPGETVLVGASFGGVLAQFMANHLEFKDLLVVSSASTCESTPMGMRVLGSLRPHRLVPESLLKAILGRITFPFGISKNEDKVLFRKMIGSLPKGFLKWALSQLSGKWECPNISKIKRCHGTKDYVFPISRQVVDFEINGAGHFLVKSHHQELNLVLDKILRR